MVSKHFGFVTTLHLCLLVLPSSKSYRHLFDFPEMKRIIMKWFESIFETFANFFKLGKQPQVSKEQHSKSLTERPLDSLISAEGWPPFQLALSSAIFPPLCFTLRLQPRKCALTFPSRKILLLLFSLHFFLFIFFLPYESLPCSLCILFWYLSPSNGI